MLCSNCGKDIPMVGKVCPWCHVDKSKDQVTNVLATVGALVGAAIGLWLGDLGGAVAGFVGGAVAGGITGNSLAAKKKG